MDVQIVYSPAPGPAAAGGITIVGWREMASRLFDLTTLDAIGSASGTGDGGTIAENDYVAIFHGYTSNANRTLGIVTAGYTSLVEGFSNAGGRNIEAGWFGKLQGPTPDTSVEATYNGASDVPQMGVAFVLRGVDTVTQMDVTPPTAANTVTPPAITPPTANALVLGGVYLGGNNTADPDFTAYGNMTAGAKDRNLGGTYDGATGVAYHENGSGLFTPTAWSTSGTHDNQLAMTIALRPA